MVPESLVSQATTSTTTTTKKKGGQSTTNVRIEELKKETRKEESGERQRSENVNNPLSEYRLSQIDN